LRLYTRVLKNQYHDSVVLMLAAKEIKKIEHVIDAAYMMGTDVNKDLLKDGGMLSAEADTAQANDLIIAIKTDQELTQILDLPERHLKKEGWMKQTRSAVRSASILKRIWP